MTIPTCFGCGRMVLGLVGQEVTLDTFYLRDDADDQQVGAEGAFGECHLVCLTRSKWGAFWAKRTYENFRDVRGYTTLFSSDTLHVLRNDRMNETAVVRMDGWIALIADRALVSSSVVNGGRLLPVQRRVTYREFDDAGAFTEFINTLKSTGSFRLSDLVQRLRLLEYMLYPIAIANGTITATGGTGKSARHAATKPEVTVTLSHQQFVPEDVAQLILKS